tara:strand:- start:29 stop:415 length:387 start_codon:yes stop_codon:yes gene_type:complete
MWEGILMMGGMVAGAVTNTLNNSFAGVEDACSALDQANKHLSQMEDSWSGILESQEEIAENFQMFIDAQVDHGQAMAGTTEILKNQFKVTTTANIIGFCVALFSVILGLLFKYFRIFPRIWNLITGGK